MSEKAVYNTTKIFQDLKEALDALKNIQENKIVLGSIYLIDNEMFLESVNEPINLGNISDIEEIAKNLTIIAAKKLLKR